jgi:adenine deaminase
LSAATNIQIAKITSRKSHTGAVLELAETKRVRVKSAAAMELIRGLMSDEKADICAEQNENIRIAAHKLGCPDDVEPFMNMSFVSLPVIPHIKLTTLGLFDVDNFCLIPLFAD